MKHSFLFDLDASYIVIFLFFSMLLAIRIGYTIGFKKPKKDSDDFGILSSLLGLVALLLAFTFGMAGSRYENRRTNVINEANSIGTAILRSDVYPDSLKKVYKADFQTYLNARIDYFESNRDDDKINSSLKKSEEYSKKLWNRASFYAKNKDYFIQSNMMLPALNDMFDAASSTNTVYNSAVPESIVYLLLVFSIIISFYIGYSSGSKKIMDKYFIVGFCLLSCVVILVTLDLDRPRRGLIDLGNEISLLKELKSNF
jgi:hypothetical protein